MLDGRLFDKLELVLSGDFFQLPPVPEQDSTSKIPSTFAFDALSWPNCIDQSIILSQVFRQTDSTFIDMLSAMRSGELEDWHIEQFLKLNRALSYSDGILPTQLFPLKKEVESCNKEQLQRLPGPEYSYRAMDSRGFNMTYTRITKPQAEQLLDRLVVPREINLRIGAQVMLLRNLPPTPLVNGSVGQVIEFVSIHEAVRRHIEIATLDEKKHP
ncbi:hypothetical protein BJ138DRAFT_1147006, partial [Hygrophoropsis aurantiaca]